MKKASLVVAVVFLLIGSILGSIGTVTAAEIGSSPSVDETCGESTRNDVSESRTQTLPILKINITPAERQIESNQTEVFLVCIANPRRYNKTVTGLSTTFWHNGTKADEISIVGPNKGITTSNHVGMLPLDILWNDGVGRGVASGKLESGEVVQYTIFVSNTPSTGKRRLKVETQYHFFHDTKWENFTVKETAKLRVVCPPSCMLSVGVELVATFLRKYGTFLVAIIGTTFTILSVLVALFGPEKVKNSILLRGRSGEEEGERVKKE